MNKVIYSVYPAKDLPKVTPDVIYIKKNGKYQKYKIDPKK